MSFANETHIYSPDDFNNSPDENLIFNFYNQLYPLPDQENIDADILLAKNQLVEYLRVNNLLLHGINNYFIGTVNKSGKEIIFSWNAESYGGGYRGISSVRIPNYQFQEREPIIDLIKLDFFDNYKNDNPISYPFMKSFTQISPDYYEIEVNEHAEDDLSNFPSISVTYEIKRKYITNSNNEVEPQWNINKRI